MMHDKPNIEILFDLDEKVDGHIKAKKALITLVNRSRVRFNQKWINKIHEDLLVQSHKCLLIGQSGTGKTHLVESLQSIVDFPLVRVDATRLNPTGASGGVKENTLKDLIISEAEYFYKRKEGLFYTVDQAIDQVVVFIDEIDKLGEEFDSSGKWNSHVQSNFLTLFDNKEQFSGVSFIFAGAFTDITNKKQENKNLGFVSSVSTDEAALIDEDIIKTGLIPELVGRLTSIVELDVFTFDDYVRILKNRLIPKKTIDLAYFGVYDIVLTEEEIFDIADKAVKSNQGIRYLQRELDKVFMDHEFNYENPRYNLLGVDNAC